MSTHLVEDQLRVLVVDDDPLTNKVVTRYLTRYGHRVRSAEDGQAALAMFQAGEYDAVISDIMMPKMDGWQLAAALHAVAPELPILMITAYSAGGGSWNQEALKSRGVDALLNKPIDFQHLLGLLEDIKLRKKGNKP